MFSPLLYKLYLEIATFHILKDTNIAPIHANNYLVWDLSLCYQQSSSSKANVRQRCEGCLEKKNNNASKARSWTRCPTHNQMLSSWSGKQWKNPQVHVWPRTALNVVRVHRKSFPAVLSGWMDVKSSVHNRKADELLSWGITEQQQCQ